MRKSAIQIFQGGSPNHLSTEEISSLGISFFVMAPGRVVALGLEADDSCEEEGKSCVERAVKLRLE